jgi:hypothetical protein
MRSIETMRTGFKLKFLLTLAVAVTVLHQPEAMLAQRVIEDQQPHKSHAGTWHWLRNGEAFSTMILVQKGDSYSGSVTQSRISLAEDGTLDMADPVPGAPPEEIREAILTGPVLHLRTKDGFAFAVTFIDSDHATIKPDGAPPNMKPIPAQRVE